MPSLAEFYWLSFSTGSFWHVFYASLIFRHSPLSTERKPSPDLILGALTLHMPSFMRADPQLWLNPVELEFMNFKVSSDISRFRWVISRLPPYVALQAEEFIASSHICDASKEAASSRTTNASNICFKGSSSGIRIPWSYLEKCGVLKPQRSSTTRC